MKSRFKFYGSWQILLALTLCAILPSTDAEEKTAASFAQFDRSARAGKSQTVIFFGGALAAGEGASDPKVTSYRALMEAHLKLNYPAAQFTFHEVAFAGTGSKFGMFRLGRDVLIRQPNLLFIDFTVEDNLNGTDRQTLASYERILREVISEGIPVVAILNGTKDFAGPDWKYLGPPRFRDHLEMAKLYHVGIGNSLVLIQNFLMNNQARTRDQIWTGDGAAATDLGHRFIYLAARAGLEEAIQDKRICYVPRDSVFASEYKNVFQFFPGTYPMPSGWRAAVSLRENATPDSSSMNEVAVCDGKERDSTKPLSLNFNGSFLGILGEATTNSLSYKLVVDGKTIPYAVSPQNDVWPTRKAANDGKNFFWHEVTRNFSPGRHTVEIYPVFNLGSDGELRIQSICVAGMDPEATASAILAR
ncbi:MAG: hypothetical protein ABIP71_14010 [Verrucomicrobiota bacterium]